MDPLTPPPSASPPAVYAQDDQLSAAAVGAVATGGALHRQLPADPRPLPLHGRPVPQCGVRGGRHRRRGAAARQGEDRAQTGRQRWVVVRLPAARRLCVSPGRGGERKGACCSSLWALWHVWDDGIFTIFFLLFSVGSVWLVEDGRSFSFSV